MGGAEHQKGEHGDDQTGGLQGVGAHEGCGAAFLGVTPDKEEGEGYRQWVGYTYRAGNELLKYEADKVEAGGSSCEFAQQEEEGADAVGMGAETQTKVGVDAGQVQPVVEWEEEKGHGKVAETETGAHLEVGHACGTHPAGYGDEGDTRHAGADHAECYHPPGGTAPGAEEGVVVVLFCSLGCNPQQQEKIGC
ncbi:hypothetical protein EVA_05138 [gut metagenome]|uniref:Uncharacterized protein n=1 Tax=gut metagenome TaxID=749906 RepID=J9GV50_9ZZZZ